MAKVKKSLTGHIKKDPVEKTTRQGCGRGSKPSHGRKMLRGQGKG